MNNPSTVQKNNRESVWQAFLVDFKTTIQVYEDNWKPFTTTIIVGGFGAFLTIFCFMYIAYLAGVLENPILLFATIASQPPRSPIPNATNNQLIVENIPMEWVIPLLIVVFAVIGILYGLIGSLFGLSFDIFSSGEEFTEARNSWKYFRSKLFPFFIGGIFFSLSLDAARIETPLNEMQGNTNIIEYYGLQFFITLIIIMAIAFLFNTLFTFLLPAIVANSSFSKAWQENFSLIRRNFFRVISLNIFIAILIYICYIPGAILFYARAPQVILILVLFIEGSFVLIVMNPIRILIITRAYNSVKFKEIERIKQENSN